MQTQIYTDQQGRMLDVSSGQRGPKADVKIWNETILPDEIKEQPKLGDKASSGAKKATQIPKKKPKEGELGEAEKAERRRISQARIDVEHRIRKGKS